MAMDRWDYHRVVDKLHKTINDINTLSTENEMINAVSHIVLTCPESDFDKLSKKMRVFSPINNAGCTLLIQAIEVYSRIHSLNDSRNTRPYAQWLNQGFPESLFIQFQQLAREIVDREPQVYAEAFFDTPEANKDEVVDNLGKIFQDTEFFDTVKGEFILSSLLKEISEGDAKLVFTESSFKISLFLQFSEKVEKFLAKSDLNKIAENLAQSDNKGLIRRRLELIKPQRFSTDSKLNQLINLFQEAITLNSSLLQKSSFFKRLESESDEDEVFHSLSSGSWS